MCTHGGQKKELDLELELQEVVSLLTWLLDLNLGLLEQQQVLLTSHLSSTSKIFFNYMYVCMIHKQGRRVPQHRCGG